MAYIKQFKLGTVRVPDPLRPGKRTFEERIHSTGAHSLSHDGVTYNADEDGWFEVPLEAAEVLLKRRHATGEQFFTPDEVGEQVRLGALTEEEAARAEPVPVAKTQPQRRSKE